MVKRIESMPEIAQSNDIFSQIETFSQKRARESVHASRPKME